MKPDRFVDLPPGNGLTGYVLMLLVLLAVPARAQAPLHYVNDNTTVQSIDFKFLGTRTFEEPRLKEQMATTEPTFWDKVRRVLPFVSADRFPFSPVQFQKDIVRLRRFYERHGFLHPEIAYTASQLDTVGNDIRLIIAIEEGPPLIIQDVGFFEPEGEYAYAQFDEGLRARWIDFRDEVTLRAGTRYTAFEGVRIQDEIVTWLRDRGFAFPRVERAVEIDSLANTVDIRFLVDAGPQGYVSEILVEGHERVPRDIVLRELPFSVGSRFSGARLAKGQRELFSLNLFRLALADVPEQPRDSSVVVRYRVREAPLRYLSAQTGYARDNGVTGQAEWRHRNFLGGARLLTISGTVRSGLAARPPSGQDISRRFDVLLSLRQPYLFVTDLLGILAPYYIREVNPNQDLRYQEVGLNTTLLYEIYPFRAVSLQHTFGRAYPIGTERLPIVQPEDGLDVQERGIYDRSVFSLSGTFGDVDDFLDPAAGLLVRPFLEAAGEVIQSEVEYYKASNEAVGYLPLGRFNLSARLFGGRLWPYGQSAQQTDPNVEYRFDRIRFYAGGSSDVRGWGLGLLGPKIPRADIVRDEAGNPVLSDGVVRLRNERYETVGGLAKLAGNVEVRMPFPGLGNEWRTGAFVDFGKIFLFDKTFPSPDFPDRTLTVTDNALRVGVGAGIRYETAVGHIRLDVAYKVNPSFKDLRDPGHLFRYVYGFTDEPPEPDFWNRFKLHVSIGQAF